jgi:UDP-N-acetylmuramate dehydrogenase
VTVRGGAIESTLGVPSRAERLVVIRDLAALQELAERLRAPGGQSEHAVPGLTVLGGGSNVVLLERVPGTVCLMRNRGIRLEPGPRGSVLVTAAAGERWHDLVRFCLGQGLAGLENLALIPGSVGAAPIQNVGAYGVELADRFVALRALDLKSGELRELDRRACDFRYRDSVFKRPEAAHLVIVDVTLRLHRRAVPVLDYPDLQLELERLGRAAPTPVDVAEAVVRVRRRKLPDPRRVGNAGSFFKNPELDADRAEALMRRHPALQRRPGQGGRVKLSAAQLIDACGWKGRTVGRVGVWHRQPLVLVNRGGATGQEVLELGEAIRRDVGQRFGVQLEREPRVIGRG